jgi:hypothetical protein
MLSFSCSVLSSSLVSRLLHHLATRSWLPPFMVSVPLVELVQFAGRMIVESNVRSSDPPVQR